VRGRTNLPTQLTSFVGREKEIVEVMDLLGRARLLTLTGTGGCGKTRLALKVVGNLAEVYSDGVWLVDLAPLADPSLVLRAVASVYGVRDEPGHPLLSRTRARIRSRPSADVEAIEEISLYQPSM
jgi:predicted ATPase